MREVKLCDTCGTKFKDDICPKCEKSRLSELMRKMFNSIWKTRRHFCVNCNDFLGTKINACYFDHTLEKAKYPQLMLEPENIMLLCTECHGTKTNGFPSPLIKRRIEELKKKFNILK